MKKIVVMLALFGIILEGLGKNPTGERGIQFFHGSWSEALKKAENEKKILFVDFYADWCGPCKWMSKEVFTDEGVGQYFNEHIVAVKVNAEKEEVDLVTSTGIQAYPTLAVFSATGEVLAKTEGALAANDLLAFISSIGSADRVYKEYEKDSTNFEKFSAYLQVLKFGDQSKISQEVTKFMDRLTLEQLHTESAWLMVANNLDNFNSTTFKTMCENGAWFKANHADFEEVYSWFMKAMLAKAVENKDADLLQQLKDRYITVRKSLGTMKQNPAYYEKAIDLAYRKQIGDSTYAADVLEMAVAYHGDDWKVLTANVLDVLQGQMATRPDKQSCLSIARKALAMNNNAFTNWTLAASYEANADLKDSQVKSRNHLLEAIRKATPDQVNLNGGGYATLTFSESANSIVNVVTNLE